MDDWVHAGDFPCVFVVQIEALREDLRKPEYQLFYAHDRVYETIVGTFLANNPKQTEGMYYKDFAGVLKDEYLPEWARREIELIHSEQEISKDSPSLDKSWMETAFDDDDDGCLNFDDGCFNLSDPLAAEAYWHRYYELYPKRPEAESRTEEQNNAPAPGMEQSM